MRLGILVHNEYLKTRRRTAFWVASLVFAGLLSLVFGSMVAQGMRDPKQAVVFPAAWGSIVGGPGVLAAFFSAIVLILLVSSEFTWRTSRQNVIDGLSKEEFFGAKLLLIPGVGLFFFAVLLLLGGGIGVGGTLAKGALASASPFIRPADLALMGGAFLGLLGWASFAFFLGITIRSTGSAIGAFFLYFLVEQILGAFAGSLGPGVAAAFRFAPNVVFKSLWEPVRYGVVPLKAGQSLGVETQWYVVAGAAWVAVFLVASFVLYRRKDL